MFGLDIYLGFAILRRWPIIRLGLDLGSVAGGAVFAAQCGRVSWWLGLPLVVLVLTEVSRINDGFNSDPATGMVFVARSCLVACPWTDHW